MSLHLLQETTPIAYEVCLSDDLPTSYNAFLCTPPRNYREELFLSTGIWGFWYDANKDKYILLSLLGYVKWPGWRINSWEIDPITGVETLAIRDRSVDGLTFLRGYENSDFNKVYALSITARDIKQIDPVTMQTLDPVVLEEANLVPPVFIHTFVIARGKNQIFVSTTNTFSKYQISDGALLSKMSSPAGTLADMAYEDNERAWATYQTPDGLTGVLKVNYDTMKYEIITKLQPGASPDLDSAIAYDSKRKNIAVFRQRANAVDGAAEHVLGIYKPFTEPIGITEPVPVGELIPGRVTTFIAHLYGSGGEVGQLQTVTVTNTGDGTILQPTVTPASNGAVSVQYLAGQNPGSDTITFQVTVP